MNLTPRRACAIHTIHSQAPTSIQRNLLLTSTPRLSSHHFHLLKIPTRFNTHLLHDSPTRTLRGIYTYHLTILTPSIRQLYSFSRHTISAPTPFLRHLYSPSRHTIAILMPSHTPPLLTQPTYHRHTHAFHTPPLLSRHTIFFLTPSHTPLYSLNRHTIFFLTPSHAPLYSLSRHNISFLTPSIRHLHSLSRHTISIRSQGSGFRRTKCSPISFRLTCVRGVSYARRGGNDQMDR